MEWRRQPRRRSRQALLQKAAPTGWGDLRRLCFWATAMGGAVAPGWGLSRPNETRALVPLSPWCLSAVGRVTLGWQYKVTGSCLWVRSRRDPIVTAYFCPRGSSAGQWVKRSAPSFRARKKPRRLIMTVFISAQGPGPFAGTSMRAPSAAVYHFAAPKIQKDVFAVCTLTNAR